MRSHTLNLILTVSVAGCSTKSIDTGDGGFEIVSADDHTIPPAVAKAFETTSAQHAQGLIDASVIVHRAYEYSGYSWMLGCMVVPRWV